MSYYPSSQIKPNQYTNGGEYILSTTKEIYKGYYYELSNEKEDMVVNQNNSSQQQTSQNNSNSSQGSDQIQNFFSKNFGTDLTNALSFK